MPKVLCLLVVLLLNLLSAWCVIAFEYHHLHDENQLFENLQVLLLALGVLSGSILLRGIWPVSLPWAGLALLCFSLLLREVDLDLLPLPGPLQALGTSEGRALLLAPLWAGLGLGFLRLGSGRWRWLQEVLASRLFACQVLALLLLLASALVDRKLATLVHPRLWEELLEINAYFVMIWPAVLECGRRLAGRVLQPVA